MGAHQQASFQDRVARVREAQSQVEATRPEPARDTLWDNAKYPLSFVFALLVGVAATLLLRYCQYHMLGLPAQAENPDMQMVMDNVFAVIVAGVIRTATNFATSEHMMFKMIGVWIVILGFHNLSHWAPGAMSVLFSPEYVREVTMATWPDTIIFRDMVVNFGREPVFTR